MKNVLGNIGALLLMFGMVTLLTAYQAFRRNTESAIAQAT